MSQDNEVANINRDLTPMERSTTKQSSEEWSDIHSTFRCEECLPKSDKHTRIVGRVIQLPRTDRRQLYKDKEYVPLEKVKDWQQTCPPNKRITDVGTKSEEDIRLALELNKRVAISSGKSETIECDALLMRVHKCPTPAIWDDDYLFDRGRGFHIDKECPTPAIWDDDYLFDRGRGFHIDKECPTPDIFTDIYSTPKLRIGGSTFVEFLTSATQSGCRSFVTDLSVMMRPVSRARLGGSSIAFLGTSMSQIRKWLEQNYTLVDKIIFCADNDVMYDRLTKLMLKHFPVYEVNIPESKLPAEILRKGSRAIQIYKEALSNGKHAVQNIRVMLVGQSGVGKTTLLKRLLGQDVDIKKIESTEGIEVHVHRCKIDLKSGRWHCQDEVPPHPNEALHLAILPLLTRTPKDPLLQTVQDTSPKSDSRPIYDDEVKYRRLQTVNDVDVTIASEPESAKSDAHASTVLPQSSSSKIDDTKVEQQIKELIETFESSKSLSDSNIANVSFWDFAGQYIFYNTHQVFLSHRTVYLLVTKLKHIVNEAGSQRQDFDTKMHDTIEFWVNSIHFFCGKENRGSRVPPVILVATHADEVDQKSLIDNHFTKVRDIFANKITAGHIVDKLQFAVDNSVEDPQLEELKKSILEVARTQYYWQEEHPVRWLTLEKELFAKGNSGEKVLRLEAVKDINRMLPFPLGNSELDLFLQFQSDLGNILYISEGELKDYVLLNPQWVADAFKCIITAEHFLDRKMMLREHWKQAKKTGKINTEIIEEVWRDKKPERFIEEREFLLLLMQQLNLIARPIEPEQPHNHFFVPCLITERPSCPPIHFKGVATSVLTLSVESKFFPMILFYKLIASCIQKYPIHKDHIYNCSALFEHDLHVFTVLYVDNTVKVWVNSLDEDNPDIMVCHRILKFLIECMNKLQLSCIKTPSVAVFACCPEVDMNSVQGMHQLPDDIDQWQALSKEKVVCSNEKCASHTVSMRDALKYWIPGSNNAAGVLSDPNILARCPTQLEIVRMSTKIGTEFSLLGIMLGLSQVDLQHIALENHNKAICQINAMLNLWMTRQGSKSTIGLLKKAMGDVGIDTETVLAQSLETSCADADN